MRTRRAARLLGALPLLWACASSPQPPASFGFDVERTAEESSPLGGEALELRKRELGRAHSDMGHFLATLDGLRHRRERSGQILFQRFVDAYLGTHLDPLLQHAWQSRHPEVMALDASLRLAKADVLIQMRETRRAQQVLDELAARFAGRENMLVESPTGAQTTLGQALDRLHERKWRG